MMECCHDKSSGDFSKSAKVMVLADKYFSKNLLRFPFSGPDTVSSRLLNEEQ